MDNFNLKKYLAEGKLTNEGIFGTSYEKEQRKLEDALDRFVKYSMENGDSEDEILSTLERKGRDVVDIYLGGKIDDDKLDKMYTDVMGEGLAEGRLTESASYKAFKNLIGALSKYKNVRASSQDPVNNETYSEVEELIRRL